MTEISNRPGDFECQVRSIDEFGRSGSLWIPILSNVSLDDAKASGMAQLEKQKEDSDRLQFQIINSKTGEVACAMNPPHTKWEYYLEDEVALNSRTYATKEDLKKVRALALGAYAVTALAVVLGIVLLSAAA